MEASSATINEMKARLVMMSHSFFVGFHSGTGVVWPFDSMSMDKSILRIDSAGMDIMVVDVAALRARMVDSNANAGSC